MPEETDPYYIIGFADYVFIGSTLSDGTSVTLPNGNKRLEYDISVSECLKGNLAKKMAQYKFLCEIQNPAWSDPRQQSPLTRPAAAIRH